MRRIGIAVGVVLVGVAVALFFLYSHTEVERALRRGDWVNVLVVGVDSGAQGVPEANLVAVMGIPPHGRGGWLSLPGDLSVPDENTSWAALSQLYAEGGIDGLRGWAESLLEIPIPYWVEVDFAAFRELVDLVGGVEVTVDRHLVYVDQSAGLYIDIPAGRQLLDGEQALKYVRFRGEGEAQRLERVHKLLRALLDEMTGLPWTRWRELVRAASERVETNLDVWEAVDLAGQLRDLAGAELTFHTVPILAHGEGVRPDLVRVRQLVAAVYRGEEFLTRDQLQVVVLNGAGIRFLAHRTAAWLAERGFDPAGVGDADRYDYSRTLVLHPPGEQVAAALVAETLPPPVEVIDAGMFGVERLGGWPERADVVLILGEGFDVRS
ncbi:MAG: LCP family protein [Candidatus Bipolaricaulaceae bacterium]